MAMETVLVDGVSLAYEIHGHGEPALFIHGALIADAYRPLWGQRELVGAYRCIAYHRRGYGASDHPPGAWRIERHAADGLALLGRLGVERAHVVGHSYGGCVAAQLALDAPDRVHTLALLEPAIPVGESGDAYRESLRQGARRFQQVGAAAMVDEFMTARDGPNYRAKLDATIPGAFEQAVADCKTSFETELPSLDQWSFGEAQARRIPHPVLVVLGEQSPKLGSRFADTHHALMRWLPAPEEFVLPGATHGLHQQSPGDMAKGLAAFWQRHPIEPHRGDTHRLPKSHRGDTHRPSKP
jgi:pimeloyl-ACP methyl ester carboxylesterase